MPIAVIRSFPPESGAIIEVSGDPNCFMPYSTMRSRSRAKVGDIVKVEAVPNRRGDGVVYSEREYYERNTPIGDEVDGIVRHVTGDRNAAFVDIGVLNDGRLGASDVITHSSREKLAVKVGDLLRLRVSGVREDARGRRRFSLCSPEVYERDEFLEQNRAEWSERLAHWKNVLGVRQATIEHEHSLLSRFKYSEHIIGSNSVKLSVSPRHRQALDHQVGQDISFHIVRSDGTYLDALSGIEDIEFDPESNLLEVNVGRRNWTIQDRDLEEGELQECRHDPNVERQRIALDNFEKLSIANPKLGGTFINIEGAVLKQRLPCATYFDKNVGTNANQRDIVERALASDPLFLIQGPPGTGKTTVITEIILQEAKRNPNSLILLSSQSNIAVDNVLEKLVDSPLDNSFLRYGQADRVQNVGWTLEGRIAASYEAYKNSNIALLTKERKECENHLRTFLKTQLQVHQERLRSLQELKASRPWEAVQERLEEAWGRWDKSREVEKGRRKEVEQHEIELRREKDGSLSLHKKQTLLQSELDRVRRIDPGEPIHNVLAAKKKLDLSISDVETARGRVLDERDRVHKFEDKLISTKQQLYHLSGRWWRRYFSRDRIAELTESSWDTETKLSSAIGKHQELCQTMHNCEEAAKAATTDHDKWRANCLAMMRELRIRESGLSEEELLRDLQENLTTEYAGGLERRLTSLRQNQVTDIQSEIDQTKSSICKAEENVASHQKTLGQLKALHEEALRVRSEDRKAFILTCEESLKDDEPGWIEYRKAAQLSFKYLYDHLEKEERFTSLTFTSKLDGPVKEFRSRIVSCEKSIQIKRSRIQEIDREITRFENNEDKAGKFQEYEKSIIESCRVIGATCSHAASGRVVGFLEARGRNAYDLVIIDEAAKATEPEVLVPLQRAQRVILVGDERQLPPYLDDEDFDPARIQEHASAYIGTLAERNPDELKGILSTSLFQSLVEQAEASNGDILRSLTTQYRMHESIGTMVSEVFYEGTVVNGPQERNHGIASLESSAIWYSTSGCHSWERRPGSIKGYYNPLEVEIIRDLMRSLEKHYRQHPADEAIEVGVITGYRAQVSELSRALAPGNRNRWKATNVEIATVDAFQGKDKDIILFSVVRSNDRGIVGFLKDPRRLNVALSRAKNLLIIVGNVATVEESGKQGRSYLNDVYQHVRQNEGWRIVERLALFAS